MADAFKADYFNMPVHVRAPGLQHVHEANLSCDGHCCRETKLMCVFGVDGSH